MSLTAIKPEILADREGDTLGDHLRRTRRARGLRQIDVALLLGVDEHSIVGWEKGAKHPNIRMYPAILSFLGYEPWPVPTSLPERLIAERRRRGMSTQEAADEIGIDQGTYLRWEAGRTGPWRRSKVEVDRFLREA